MDNTEITEVTEKKDKYIGTVLAKRYGILELIGEGGMAKVYRAIDNRLNRFVAVKILKDEYMQDEELKRRFASESHAVAMLSHPNIVSVFDVSHDDDLEYIVMELVDGITLKQYLSRKNGLSWKETVHFAKQIAKALSHAHERSLIHRDIKPQNIMLLLDGTIKVADFGIAALENETDRDSGEELSTSAVGSIYYISPEQIKNSPVDARSDIYSLGIVMYEMLTGVLPFTGDSFGEIAVKHMNSEPIAIEDLNSSVPEGLIDITMKAMERDIDKRYQSAEELIADLDRFSQENSLKDQSKYYYDEELEESDIPPVIAPGELSKDAFERRRIRSRKVSFLSGAFLVILSTVAVFVLIWNYWLGELFKSSERYQVPDFTGRIYTDFITDPNITKIYKFKLKYNVDLTHEYGTVLEQSPVAGRNVMLSDDGISVSLTIASGLTLTDVPNVVGMDYREAQLQLENAGFKVSIESGISETVEKNNVISTSPSADEQLSPGSVVYITVSSGNEASYTTVPNLIGYTENSAYSKLDSCRLSVGTVERVESDLEPGTVIWQNIEAYTEIEEFSKISLRVSTGPSQALLEAEAAGVPEG